MWCNRHKPKITTSQARPAIGLITPFVYPQVRAGVESYGGVTRFESETPSRLYLHGLGCSTQGLAFLSLVESAGLLDQVN